MRSSEGSATSEGAHTSNQRADLYVPIILKDETDNNDTVNAPLTQLRYSLRSHVFHVDASVIIDMPRHVQTFAEPLK